MRAPLKKLGRKLASVSFAASLAAASVLQVGCESEAERADEQISQAFAAGAQADTPEARAAAAQKAAAVQNASPAARIDALVRLAHVEVAQAVDLMQQINAQEVQIAQHVGEINRLATRIASNNTLMFSYRRAEPKEALAAFGSEKTQAATGVEGTPYWHPHDQGPLPALATVDKTIADLQKQISQLEQRASSLASKRRSDIASAEKLERQADTLSGKDAVETFQQASGARKRAMDQAAEIEQIQSDLLPLKQDLARAQALKKHLTDAIAGFDERIELTSEAWSETEKRIEALREMSRAMLQGGTRGADAPPDAADPVELPDDVDLEVRGPKRSNFVRLIVDETPIADDEPISDDAASDDAPAIPPAPGTGVDPDAGAGGEADATDSAGASGADVPPAPPPPATVAENAAALKKLVEDVSAKRKQAEELLTSALDHYEQAAAVAQQYSTELMKNLSSPNAANMAEREAWNDLLEIYNPSSLKLQQATVHLLLARLHRSATAELMLRENMLETLNSVVQESGLTVPPDLKQDSIAEDRKAAEDAAAKAYEQANNVLQEIVGSSGGMESMRQAARSAHMTRLVSLLGEAQLLNLSDGAKAEGKITDAQAAARASDAPVPPGELPGFLQDALGLRAVTEEAPAVAPAPDAGETPTPPGPGVAAPADSPEAAAARAAAVSFMQALTAGDADTAKSMADLGPKNDLYVQAMADVFSRYARLREALRAKWPDQDTSSLTAAPDFVGDLQSAAVAVEGDIATVSTPAGGEGMTVKKQQDGTWKVVMDVPENELTPKISIARARIAAIDKALAGLEAGKYSTPADVVPDLAIESILNDGDQ